MEIVKSNGSFLNFYPNLPETVFKLEMSKNEAQIWNEHFTNTRDVRPNEAKKHFKYPKWQLHFFLFFLIFQVTYLGIFNEI